MAFTQSTFAPASSSAANTPKIFAYDSSDSLATVTTTGYFIAKQYQLSHGDWIFCNLVDGVVILEVASDTSSATQYSAATLPVDNCRIGFFDYNDAATASSPIAVTGGAGNVGLTNDELGSFTIKTYAPASVSDVWNASTDRFDWTDLKLGDMVDIRLDITVTTASPNTNIIVDLELAIGSGTPYFIEFAEITEKTAAAHTVERYNGIYMGNTETLNNPARFVIRADGNCTVVVNGWYCKVLVRG